MLHVTTVLLHSVCLIDDVPSCDALVRRIVAEVRAP